MAEKEIFLEDISSQPFENDKKTSSKKTRKEASKKRVKNEKKQEKEKQRPPIKIHLKKKGNGYLNRLFLFLLSE